MYIWDNFHSAKCFSGKCPFWKVFFGEMYRIPAIEAAKVLIAKSATCSLKSSVNEIYVVIKNVFWFGHNKKLLNHNEYCSTCSKFSQKFV